MPDGTEKPGQAPDCKQAITPDVAAAAAYALAGVMNGGTGSRSNPDLGVPLIGKTGTTDSAYDTWVITSSTNITTAVWVGNSIGKVQLYGYSWQGFAGNVLRHEIMRNTLATTLIKYGGGGFPDPPASSLVGSGITVPDVKGLTPEAAKALLEALGFGYLDGGPTDSEVPAGKVAGTDPPAGTLSGTASIIKVFTSKGNKVAFPDVVGDGTAFDFASAKSDIQSAGFTKPPTETCVVLKPISPALVVDPGDPRIDKVQSTTPSPGEFAVKTASITIAIGKISC
jgi:membrane peptidoglycan carboxypeptidase